ncbi:hypothetical protein ACIQNU_37570 [Streptomyces sp. NPDC091292]|uniref:hypothetical protein n=1 Tax=Streptomyces sp. NPDC091292 TaxID=3365991 RepID=UPI003817D81A
MRQCKATADVHPGFLVFAILAGQGHVYGNDLERAPSLARCELGLWHEGEHSDHVWDWPDSAAPPLWVHWNAGHTMRFESLAWCETPGGPDGDACKLYRDHAREHSWDLFDPETEALRRRVHTEWAQLIKRLGRKPD